MATAQRHVRRDLIECLFPERLVPSSRRLPDYDYIHKEMAKSGVTLSLVWNEYCETCRLSHEVPFMYTQFCKYYREYANVTKATMHIDRKPGELLEVDWMKCKALHFAQSTNISLPGSRS